MKKHLFLCVALAALVMDAALVQRQQLTIQTEAGKQTVLSRADIENLPRTVVKTQTPAASVVFEGVPLKLFSKRPE